MLIRRFSDYIGLLLAVRLLDIFKPDLKDLSNELV